MFTNHGPAHTTHHASRFTHHASRITHHATRFTHHVSRFIHHLSNNPAISHLRLVSMINLATFCVTFTKYRSAFAWSNLT